MKGIIIPSLSRLVPSGNIFRKALPLLALSIAGLASLACANATAPEPRATSEPQVSSEPAPIESVSLEVTSVDPVHADLLVVSGLPNSCYSIGERSVSQDGDTFNAKIMNLLEGGPEIACAQVYRMETTRLSLGDAVEPCKTYAVVVNSQEYSLQAMGSDIKCDGASGKGIEAVKLAAGGSASTGSMEQW